ncbi:hypothetical protein C4K88_01080 [Arthrobacter pityocampae]|uniref:Uncharacterized protein n=1 Tax=Arthrobacter pityocampae TaxID=547334 RepID=A0A2S5J1A5_9MICC|nr:hypothetical protein [Arthrobacter pityocampae]PPB50520.1 hypothetical protein C4K88_01080 [Arthrobacter pityocampae]
MTEETLALWVQVAAVLVALGASMVALLISAQDRRAARKIAEEDRRAALLHGKLLFEMEALLRLTQNLRRGGSSDSQTSKDMGAEAGALIGALGPDLLPQSWDLRIGQTEEELLRFVADEEQPGYLRRSAEAQIALGRVAEEIRRKSAPVGSQGTS